MQTAATTGRCRLVTRYVPLWRASGADTRACDVNGPASATATQGWRETVSLHLVPKGLGKLLRVARAALTRSTELASVEPRPAD